MSDKIPASFGEALRSLRSPDFIDTRKYQEQQWRAERNRAHPDIVEFEQRFIRRLRKLGIPAFAHCVIRDPQEQLRLQREGRSKAGLDGPHVHGAAVDIVHSLKAWDLTGHEWALMGHIGKEVAVQAGIEVQWGGEWKFYDPAHWELDDWKKRVDEWPLALYRTQMELDDLNVIGR